MFPSLIDFTTNTRKNWMEFQLIINVPQQATTAAAGAAGTTRKAQEKLSEGNFS